MILDGKGQVEPKVYEDLITHWKIHVGNIQDIGFKQQATPEIQATMEDHNLATEMIMFDQAQKSSAFSQLVNMQCPMFPMFFTPPKIPAEIQSMITEGQQQKAMMAQGQPLPGEGKMSSVQASGGDPGFQQSKRPDQTKVGGEPIGGIPV